MNSDGFAEFGIKVAVIFFASLVISYHFVYSAPVFFVIWGYFLYLDVASTAKIYRQLPAEFDRIERNRIFAVFAKKIRLIPAIVLFILTVELPLLVFLSISIISELSIIIIGSKSLISCLATCAGMFAFAHADGWRTNRLAT